jgi:hypothetical protein
MHSLVVVLVNHHQWLPPAAGLLLILVTRQRGCLFRWGRARPAPTNRVIGWGGAELKSSCWRLNRR